jgi:hypothetical protein
MPEMNAAAKQVVPRLDLEWAAALHALFFLCLAGSFVLSEGGRLLRPFKRTHEHQ